MRALSIGLFLLLPYGAEAAVSISEIAWMGSVESANHEWIELHNDGETTDVSGWFLKDGMNLEIQLLGTIPANSYVVLERTSDVSAIGDAFLIYTGALVNTGATIQLEREDGSLVDQVSGGENWVNIGGDNTTKETAQYTESGWKTAPATPGSGLVWSEEMEEKNNEAIVEESSKSTQTVTAKKSSGSGESVRLTLPDVSLLLKVDAQKVGYVHQPVLFKVEPSGIGDSLIDSLKYQWNFGDGFSTTDKYSQHVFKYPGTYVVTVYAGFKRQEQVARHEITILPVRMSLTMNSEGDVQINSDSPYELDISGYSLVGEKDFTFPAYSILLPNQTITIPKKQLGKTESSMVVLYDTETMLVSSLIPNNLSKENTEINIAAISQSKSNSYKSSQQSSLIETNDFTFASSPIVIKEVAEEKNFINVASAATSTQLANVGAATSETGPRFVYLALAGVLGLGILGIYAAPRRNGMQ